MSAAPSRARPCAVVVALFLAASPSQVDAQQLRIGPADIGGVVTSAKGPEAGVWVIAETTGLGTKRFAKIVVTDDQGRYLLPALPSGAQYNVWVRGFGLVDSRRVTANVGATLNLTAVIAPTVQAAAEYFSGSYWWSMLEIPAKTMFPGTGLKGNGMSTDMRSQADWIDAVKQNGCGNCHQAGGPLMRSLDHAALGVSSKDSREAWAARLRMGQAGGAMVAGAGRLMTSDGGLLTRLARWTDRISAGEVPKAKPDRPQGVERNIVVTAVGLVSSHGLSSRPDRHRPEKADGQRLGCALWRDGVEYRLGTHSGSSAPRGDRNEDAGEGRDHAAIIDRQRCSVAVALLGRPGTLGYAGQCPYEHDGRRGSCVVGGHTPAAVGAARVLPKGIESSLSTGLPTGTSVGRRDQHQHLRPERSWRDDVRLENETVGVC